MLANDPLRMAGATAFFTTFALPPILVMIIQLLGLAFNKRSVSKQLLTHLADIIGKESVHQVAMVLVAFRKLAQNWTITILGFLFLVFVATTLFKIIKSSINQLWTLRVPKSPGMWFGMRNRLQSIFVIIIAGILFALGLLAEGLQALLGKYLHEFSPILAFYLNNVLSYVISIAIVTAWFGTMFRYLPDGRPQWNIAMAGGLLTSILFHIGKLILHWLLSYSNITTVYGASASIVLLLLFVFYCALILYYGASFTRAWAIWKGKPIDPLPHAVKYEWAEVGSEIKGI